MQNGAADDDSTQTPAGPCMPVRSAHFDPAEAPVLDVVDAPRPQPVSHTRSSSDGNRHPLHAIERNNAATEELVGRMEATIPRRSLVLEEAHRRRVRVA